MRSPRRRRVRSGCHQQPPPHPCLHCHPPLTPRIAARTLALRRRLPRRRSGSRWRSPPGSRTAGCCCTGTNRCSAPSRTLVRPTADGRRQADLLPREHGRRAHARGRSSPPRRGGAAAPSPPWSSSPRSAGRCSSSRIKAIVDRDRPDLERLVNGTGPSFPSGHVMAAAALWGLVPLVVTLYTREPADLVGGDDHVGAADRRHRRQPDLPRRALAVRRRRRVHRRRLLPPRRRVAARPSAPPSSLCRRARLATASAWPADAQESGGSAAAPHAASARCRERARW